MKYAKIEGTDLRVSRLGFGTGTLHHVFQRGARLRVLERALECGISHFDTSPYYGYGMAEADLGVFLRGRREEVTIATKVGLYPPKVAKWNIDVWARKVLGRVCSALASPCIDWSVRAAEGSLDGSLRRLNTDYVDIVYLHEPHSEAIDAEEFRVWLEGERRKGRIRNWGVAGDAGGFLRWVREESPLVGIIQTKDSAHKREGDLVLQHGRQLQFTYGYLGALSAQNGRKSAEDVVRWALKRNENGSVLVSTRRAERVETLARAVL